MNIVNELYQLIAPYFLDKTFDWIYENKKAVRNREEFIMKLTELMDRYKSSDEFTYDTLCKIVSETRMIQDLIYYCTNLSMQNKTIDDKINDYLEDLLSRKDFKIIIPIRQNLHKFFEELSNHIINIFLVPDDKSIKQLINIIYYYKLELNIQNERNTEKLKAYFKEFDEKIQNLITSKYLVWTDQAIIQNQIFNPMLKTDEIPNYNFIYTRWLRNNERSCNVILERDLNNHTGEIPSPFYHIWEAFITAQQWHTVMEDKISDISNHLEYNGFETNRLKDIDINSNYNHIRKELSDFCDSTFIKINERKEKDTHHYYKELRSKMKEFQQYLKESTYGKCFFLTGRIGSGKTNFVYQMLSGKEFKKDRENLYHYLYIEIEHSDWFNNNLQAVILGKLNNLTRLQYEELEDYATMFEQKKIKLIVIIDGLQKYLFRDVRFKEELIKSISQGTYLHSLYWVITIRESDLDLIEMDSDFWNLYSSKMGDIGNWFSIDRWNEETEITINILNNSLVKTGISLSNQELKNKLDAKGFPYKILNPLTAWIINDNSDRIDILNAADLIYIDFIREFENKRMKILHEILENIDKTGYVVTNPRILTLVINNLAYYFLYNKQDSYHKNTLVEILTKNITKDILDIAFLTLEKGYLLEECDDILTEKVKRIFEIFWDYKMARIIYEKDLSAFDAYLGKEKEQILLYKDVIEFLILIMDEELIKNNKANQLVDLQNLEYIYSSSLWKAGILASNNMKKLIAELLLQRRLPENINIFSVVYFLKYVTDDVILPHEKIKALQPYYKLLTGQIAYIKNLIDSVLGNIADIDSLYQTFLYFIGCEVLNITDYVADLSLRNLIRLYDGEYKRMVKDIIKFSDDNKAIINTSEDMEENGKKYFSFYFFQSFYCRLCKMLYIKYGMKAYDSLKIMKWYDLQGSLNEKYRLWMRKAANLEYGHWYQDCPTDEYINFVSKLSRSVDKLDLINALYMIKHSVPQRQRFTYYVNYKFISTLERLIKNSMLTEEIARRDIKDFIRTNFKYHDYDLYLDYRRYLE